MAKTETVTPPQLNDTGNVVSVVSFAQAKARCWAACGVIQRSKQGQEGNQKYQYAPLEVVDAALKPILADHDLAVIQHPVIEYSESGSMFVGAETTLLHSPTGESDTFKIVFPCEGSNPKAIGKLITYAKRYSYPFAVPADEPDVDDESTGGGRRSSSSPPSGPSSERRSNPPVYGDAPENMRVNQARFDAIKKAQREQTGGDKDLMVELASAFKKRFELSSAAMLDYRLMDEAMAWIDSWPHEGDSNPAGGGDDDIPF